MSRYQSTLIGLVNLSRHIQNNVEGDCLVRFSAAHQFGDALKIEVVWSNGLCYSRMYTSAMLSSFMVFNEEIESLIDMANKEYLKDLVERLKDAGG